jgi:hypothetical protein
MNVTDLSPDELRRAAAIKDQIHALATKLHRILGSRTSEGASRVRRRRKMSPAARAKIAAAQRARWAKQRGTKAPKAAVKPRRKVSAAARNRLSQLAKARWAKAKAAGKKTL